MKRGILFDLDGTLWDSTGTASPIWNRVFDKHPEVGFRMTRDRAASLMGKTMPEIGAALFPDMDEAARMRIVDDFGEEEVAYLREHGGRLYEGVEETLASLAELYSLYIVSNCQDGYVPAFLQAHRLERYFADFEMSGRTGLDKGPNIRLLLARNGIEAAVLVGDTGADQRAAKFAGIPFIWAAYGFGRAVDPEGTIEAFPELPECLHDLWEE